MPPFSLACMCVNDCVCITKRIYLPAYHDDDCCAALLKKKRRMVYAAVEKLKTFSHETYCCVFYDDLRQQRL